MEILTNPIDAECISHLRKQSLRTDPDAFGELLLAAEARTKNDWAEWLQERSNELDRKIIVLVKGDNYIGMCGAGINRESPQSGFIWGVYLLPRWRGKGGAEMLMNAAHEWLSRNGVRKVRAKVAAPNNVAIGFYERMGYVIGPQTGTLREGSQIPVYLIEKNLANNSIDSYVSDRADSRPGLKRRPC